MQLTLLCTGGGGGGAEHHWLNSSRSPLNYALCNHYATVLCTMYNYAPITLHHFVPLCLPFAPLCSTMSALCMYDYAWQQPTLRGSISLLHNPHLPARPPQMRRLERKSSSLRTFVAQKVPFDNDWTAMWMRDASWFRLKHELPKPDDEFLFSNHIYCNGFVYMNRTMFTLCHRLWAEVFNRFQFLCWTHPTVRRVARSPCDLHTPHTHPLTIQAHPLGFTGAKISWILLSAVAPQKHFIIL